ncbi:MAG: hypothetical protein ACJA1A_000385 [Saprospiraceae bacterium]|jgi:hypothetical protein
MKKLLFLFAALIITVTSCRKDIHTDDTIFIPIGEDVTTNLHGRVVDISGRSVPEAEVIVNDKMFFTNGDGYFYMPNITVPSDGFTINVRSQNDEKVLRRVTPQPGNNTYEQIILPRGESFSVHSGDGLVMASDTTNQVTVSIQASTLVDVENNLYEGDFLTKIIYYDPTRLTTLRTMPGNLQGISKEGENVTLGSFGMVNIEVIGINGEILKLAEGKTAAVKMKASALIELFNSVPTWRLDETSGLWLENGNAELLQVEDIFFYVFDISNFNSWNCDIRELNTNLSGTILDESGVPIENRLVQFTFASGGNDFYCTGGNTNNLGNFDAVVPLDKMLTLSIYDQNCNGIIYQAEIGPFSGAENNLTIEVKLTKEHYLITGVAIDCNSDLVFDNATVFLYDLNAKVRVSTQTDADGSFAIHNTCFFGENIEDGFRIVVLDLNTFNSFSSQNFPFTEVDINVGNVFACEDLTEFINVDSGLGVVSFENPSTSFDTDSLFMSASNNQMSFTLFANGITEGTHTVDFLSITLSDDQQLSCTSQFAHTICTEAVVFTITENNDNLRYIAGNISGLLYYGEFQEPDLTLESDVFIEFRVNY